MAARSTIGRPPRPTPAQLARIRRLAKLRRFIKRVVPTWATVARELGMTERHVKRLAAGYEHKRALEPPALPEQTTDGKRDA